MLRKTNIGIIGRGKWGKKVISKLKQINKPLFVYGRDFNKEYINLHNLNWVFILSSNSSHYKLTKFFLKKKINVFCEKPLCINFKKSLELYNLAKKNNVILYVDDIEIYKKKKIKIYKENHIIRKKKDKGTNNSLINRLLYHDLYLIYEKIKNKKILNISIANKNDLNVKIIFNKCKFNFTYSIKSEEKIHKINKTNFLKFKHDPLVLMLNQILTGKANFKKNIERSIFANKLTYIILQKTKK